MKVTRFTSLTDLAPLADAWNRLARGVPFRGWAWLSAWWRHYGLAQPGRRERSGLCVLGVFDQGQRLVGLAPWYWYDTPTRGRVLRFLGLGEICSDYLSVLCEPQREEAVAEAIASWLTEANRPSAASFADDSSAWDLLELTGVDAQDLAVARLAEQLEAQHHVVHRRPGVNCWRIELPECWEQYLLRLSKNHRRQLRRLTEQMLDSGRAVVRQVERVADLELGQEILFDLHQRRRQALGQPGCFASPRFTAFHFEVMPELLHAGQLALAWVEVDGRPVAAEYQLAGEGVLYVYQTGMEPDLTEFAPGTLGNLVAIRRAIEQGYRALDFLRGDEPYKAHWRAEPRASVEFRIAANRASSRWRHGLWLAGSRVKRWLTSNQK